MSETTTTPETEKRLYEGLFLFNPAQINSSVQKAMELTQEILDRAHADTIALYKWDDRKMAYDIQKQKRGLYILTYFNCATDQVKHIERDVNLSEEVMRVMMLRADHLGETELEAAKVKADESRTAVAVAASAVRWRQSPTRCRRWARASS